MAQIITNNSGGGGGSSADAMLKSVYDPQNINADAFDYANFTNTPTIPTVNDATLTIQKNSTDVATFTANASSNVTANISVPTDTSDLTNGAGFITNSALSGYQTTSNLVTDLTNPDNTHYPSAKAVADAISGGGGGDMMKSVYDPDNIEANAFDYDNFINTPTLGTAASKDTGTSSGNVPVLDSNGKLNKSTLPGVALTDTFTVSTSSDLTSLSSAEQGDLAIVTTESKTYVLSAEPYSTAANWKEILSPTGGVTSVNSQTGAVTLDADDISDSTTTNKFVTASDKTTWSGKQDALTLPATPTQGNLVTWGANNKTLVDGGAIPSTADCVKTSGDQTIAGTKTFSTSPVVPNKTSDATNTGTAIATEAQVYKKQNTLVSGTNIKTINSTTLLGSGDIAITGVPSGGNNGDVLTNVSGTATWQAPSGGDVVVSSQAGNILTSGTKLWAGTEADYGNLGSYDPNCIYLTI